jgi:hypothetical protein
LPALTAVDVERYNDPVTFLKLMGWRAHLNNFAHELVA